ncbi:MAG TPA: VOC family protein [Nitrososphaerales archaeon]|nr:VOC family protein [Nitrososphaerales archaeon]
MVRRHQLADANTMVLRYFGIRVTNMENSLKFYTELLGLRKVKGGTMLHGGKWVLLQDPRSHQRLELNWYPEDSLFATSYIPGEGLDHIGFKVQDAASTVKKLLAKGVQVALSPKDENGIEGLYYLKDPDGNWIEFF